jgi:hypothetical protein
VLCDEHHRPLAAPDDATPGMKINVDTPLSDAALRAIARTGPGWASPLLCTDDAGRYVGVVRIPRLVHALGTAAPRRRPSRRLRRKCSSTDPPGRRLPT